MKYLILLLTLLGSQLSASSVETWSGAGPNPCYERCPLDWAMDQLTDSERTELVAQMETVKDPYFVPIMDGDVFRLATYFKAGKPIAYRTTTVAVLNKPTESYGWHMDGWSFVKLSACANWTIVEHKGLNPETNLGDRIKNQTQSIQGYPPSTVYPITPLWPSPPQGTPLAPIIDTEPWIPLNPETPIVIVVPPLFPETPETPINEIPTTPEEPAPVIPLPASVLLLLSGIAGLLLINKKRNL